jgi:hypothetical protein
MEESKSWYVYYSYEQFGRGYIGIMKCDLKLTPDTDHYWGTYFNKTFKPTEKIILFQDLTKEEALKLRHTFINITTQKIMTILLI